MSTPTQTTATDLITDAYLDMGVVQPGETPEPALMTLGLRRLNSMLGGWSLQNLTIPSVVRQVFALTAEKGVYTIGPGGDFDTPRPPSLTGAAVLLNNDATPTPVTTLTRSGTTATATITTHGKSVGQWVTVSGASPAAFNGTFTIAAVPTVDTFTFVFPGSVTSPATGTITAFFESDASDVTEIPAPILTDDMWQAIQIKTLTSALFTNVYYNPSFVGGLGQIVLWPIPTTADHALVLYRPMQLASFPSLTQTVWLPEGADEAIRYNLELRIGLPNGLDETTKAEIRDMARTTLGTYKRSNMKMSDVPLDPMWTLERRGGYNILTNGYSGGGTR